MAMKAAVHMEKSTFEPFNLPNAFSRDSMQSMPTSIYLTSSITTTPLHVLSESIFPFSVSWLRKGPKKVEQRLLLVLAF